MIIGAKYKICKRLGANVFERCQTQKFVLSQSMDSGPRRRRMAIGDYAKQLIEKQKARYVYGLGERQFGNYVKSAVEKKGVDSVNLLLQKLESRLDNVLYRSGFAKTRRQARQMVTHGHITVGGRRITIPSYQISQNEIVAVRPGSSKSRLFDKAAEDEIDITPPSWLSVDRAAKSIKVVGVPGVSVSELLFDPVVIIQFYSR